ncbi:MAG: hypothetical protein A2167_04585 [Planctomycetes bacterium RBG_13_46_10]|nr:MAG: hypothetical protein A2167_04585 [Planctomycetes bacterium RBG_13_46_10]
MAEKEKIRPIYHELQGYLSQAPDEKGARDVIYDSAYWEQYNSTIDELNNISGNNYDRFKISPVQGQAGLRVVICTYRSKLSGLISRLHGEFFSDEPAPFSEMPTTVISQSQQQSQSFQIQMLLEIQSKIDEKLPKFDEGTKERKFLEKVKSSLASIRNIAGLISLLLKVAKECGLSIEDLRNLFN